MLTSCFVGAAILIDSALGYCYWRSYIFVYFYSLCIASIIGGDGHVNGKSNHAYKLAWIIPIMMFLFCDCFPYVWRNSPIRKMKEIADKMQDNLVQDHAILKRLEQEDRGAANQAKYIVNYSACPIYTNSSTEYLTPGERKFERMLEELKKAERYIFLEYFIINKGVMWDTILEILKEKAKQGVDVRVITMT